MDKKGYLMLNGVFELGAKFIEEFKVIKPYEYLQEVKCPVLTIHGDKDTMVPYEISKKFGIPNEKSKFITLNGADHGFIAFSDETGKSEKSIRNKEFIIKKILEWIEKAEMYYE